MQNLGYLKVYNDKKKSGIAFFGKFVTEVLIFRSSRSQILFKIGVLKNFAILLEPFLIKLQAYFYRISTVAASRFSSQWILFQLNLVFTVGSCIGFCPELLWKHELNLISSHCSCSVKKGVLKNFANFTGNTSFY